MSSRENRSYSVISNSSLSNVKNRRKRADRLQDQNRQHENSFKSTDLVIFSLREEDANEVKETMHFSPDPDPAEEDQIDLNRNDQVCISTETPLPIDNAPEPAEN